MRKRHFAGLSIFQILAQFRRGIFYFFLSIYLKEFLGVSNTEMTLFATLPMIANIAAQSGIWGRISDRFKKRRLLIILGESYAAIGYLIVYWIHLFLGTKFNITNLTYNLSHLSSYSIERNIGVNWLRVAAYTIIIGFTIIEAGWSSSNLGWTTLIADLTRDSERSKTMGLLQFVGGIGNVLGVTASGFLYLNGLGFWNGYLFYISSGIMIFSIIAIFMIPESYAQLDEDYFKEIDEKDKNKGIVRYEKAENGKTQWPIKLFIWLLITLSIVNIGGNSINQMIQIHIRLPDTFAASDIVVAQLRNTSSIAMIIAGLLIGYLTARFGDSKMLLAGFSFIFIGTIALPFAPHIVIFFIYMALTGTSRVWIQTTTYSMVNRVIPLANRGKMMGYYNATFYLSWGLGGTIMTGPIADALVSSNFGIIIFYIVILFIILGSILYLVVNKYVKFKSRGKTFFYSSISLSMVFIAILSIFATKPIATLLINSGNTDSYAYKITFYVAALLTAIGIIVYLFFRPYNFELLSLDKDNKKSELNSTN